MIDAKGGKTQTLDLHNMARSARNEYLYPTKAHELERDPESVYVFTSQRAAWLRQQGHPDHLSERGIEHLWIQVKHKGTNAEWKLIAEVTFHDLRHDFAHRARQSSWLLEEIAVYAGHQTKCWRTGYRHHCALHLTQLPTVKVAYPDPARVMCQQRRTDSGKRRNHASNLPVSHSPLEDQSGDLAARAGAKRF